MRYFLFMTIEDPALANFLNLAIFALNPEEKWEAHVTLAGPFSSTRNLPKKRAYVKKVSVLGAGNFFEHGQNTVFLRIGAADLVEVWSKPDYPYNPHLTLYDGPNAKLASMLYQELSCSRVFLKFFVSKLVVASSIKGQSSPIFLRSPINFQSLFLTRNLSWRDIRNLDDKERINIAVEALSKATEYCKSI